MFGRVFALAAFPATVAGAQLPQVDSLRPISLQEAVTLAQRNAPAAVQARGTLRTTSSSVRSLYGSFVPSLNASASSNKQASQRFDALRNQVINSNSPWNYSAGLSANVELFDGGRRFADLRARNADVDAAEANETAVKYSVALQVKTQYANVLAARESEASARAQLEQAQASMRASVARVTAGAATVSDSLRSAIAVGNARLAILTAQNGIRVASATLTRLVGTPFMVTANPSDTANFAIAPIDSVGVFLMALQGPAVQQAEMSLAAARASERSSKSTYMPRITMSYGYSGSGTDPYGFGSDTTKRFLYGSSLGFSASFPLFNNFTREDNVLRARVSHDNAAAQLRESRLLAQQNIVQQLGALRTAEERIQIQQASLLAAQEDLRVQNQRYTLGASTLLDLLTSQSTLNQARAALIQARQDYRIARAQIEAVIGRDLQ
ncbi:MAG: TolC family protein [Gemmatimonadota bacterium]